MSIDETANEEKNRLRTHFISVRGAVSQTDRQRKDQRLADQIIHFIREGEGAWRRRMQGRTSLIVALYSAFRTEADISIACLRLQSLGHTVVFPKTDKQKKGLTFFRVSRTEELVKGNYGIYEPEATKGNIVVPKEIDVVCVPGLAFTRDGIRLGYGGGYYDRFFANAGQAAIRIGTGYSVQMTQTLPVYGHDARMDYLLTEEGWMACQP